MLFSIIIPTYNEQETVPKVLARIFDQASTNKGKYDYEVIVVNDGSTDKTNEILTSWETRIRLIKLPKNLGKTAAMAAGIEVSRGDYVASQDADEEYDPKDLFAIFDLISEKGYDAVYGSRLIKENKRHSLFYFAGSKFITLYYNLLFSDDLTDLSTGYKVFKRLLINPAKLDSKRFGFCPQVTCMLKKQNVKIHEVPISYNPRSFEKGKKIRVFDGFQFLHIITKAFLNG